MDSCKKLLVLIVFTFSSIQIIVGQNQSESWDCFDGYSLENFYAIVKIVAHQERTTSSELHIVYVSNNRVTIHSLISSSLERRRRDTIYQLSGIQNMDLNSFLGLIRYKQNMDIQPIIAGTRTYYTIVAGDEIYKHESKTYRTLYATLFGITDW